MRERRLQFASGCYYHLYNRGANRTSIFLDDRDYLNFLTRLKRYAALHETTIITYCLMPNHFHLLVRQETEDRSGLAVQFTCNGYAQFFNRRHEHSGTLFQGRFRRILVDRDEYLRPELWPYSNYQECIGLRRGTLVDREFITSLFGSPAAYRDFAAAWPQPQSLPTPLGAYLATLECKE